MNEARGFRPFERAAIEQSIGARFEEQVAHGPDRLAVKFGAASFTYAQLNAEANQVAHAILAARGEEAEPVAVVVEQGISLVAATLGVLKAGKFYVPLESAHPRDRLAFMLRDSRASLVLASTTAAPLVRELAPNDLRIIDLGHLDRSLPRTNPALRLSPDAYACIYYTTGSTGPPKGVVDVHRNVLHNVMRYTNGLRITSDDRLTLLQSPSFSGAVSSMFAALLNGSASFPFDVRHSSSAALADYVEDGRITIYHSVPTILRSFLGGARVFPSVRIVRLEGDQASVRDVELVRRHFAPHCVLVNGLGATETGIVRRHFMRVDTPLLGGVVPVGHAVEDMEVLILDDAARPLPTGSTGEIAVCSDYLALGYWHRPDLTHRAFVAAPNRAGRRMYRTGDLGRLRPDGCLEHLGRRDFRVKIRGETVEIADVEAALHQLPMIREAAVTARVDARGDQRLVAYFVAAPGPTPTASAIRQALASTLAPPSIPSWFESLDALPVNENLKIDRSALPDRSRERPNLDAPYVPAHDPTQARIVHIWETLLDVAPIGIRDDFLDLGGDSLLAARMIAMAGDALDADLPLAILTTGSTVEHVAASVASRHRTSAAIVALRSDGPKARFYFLHGDYLGAGAYCKEIVRQLDPEQPFYAMTPCGLDGERVLDTIEDMAERHLRALREHQPNGPYLLGGSCNGGLIALEMARRLVVAGERVDRLIIFRTSPRNANMQSLRGWIDRVGGWIDCAPATRNSLIRHLRWFVESWDERSTMQRIHLLAQKAGSAIRWLARTRRTTHDPTQAALRNGRAAATDRDLLIETFFVAALDYIPLCYRGRIDLFWPSVDDESPAEALALWKKISPEVRIEIVPGDHLTALTVHASTFAERLSFRLAADPPERSSLGEGRAEAVSASLT